MYIYLTDICALLQRVVDGFDRYYEGQQTTQEGAPKIQLNWLLTQVRTNLRTCELAPCSLLLSNVDGSSCQLANRQQLAVPRVTGQCNGQAVVRRQKERFRSQSVLEVQARAVQPVRQRTMFLKKCFSRNVCCRTFLTKTHRYQLAILLLFNEQDKWSAPQLEAQLGIPRAELKKYLDSLAKNKVKALRARTCDKEIKMDVAEFSQLVFEVRGELANLRTCCFPMLMGQLVILLTGNNLLCHCHVSQVNSKLPQEVVDKKSKKAK